MNKFESHLSNFMSFIFLELQTISKNSFSKIINFWIWSFFFTPSMLWRHLLHLICLLNIHILFLIVTLIIFMFEVDFFNILSWFELIFGFSYGGNLQKNLILEHFDFVDYNFVDELVKFDLIFYLGFILFLASCFWEFRFVKQTWISHIAHCFN